MLLQTQRAPVPSNRVREFLWGGGGGGNRPDVLSERIVRFECTVVGTKKAKEYGIALPVCPGT